MDLFGISSLAVIVTASIIVVLTVLLNRRSRVKMGGQSNRQDGVGTEHAQGNGRTSTEINVTAFAPANQDGETWFRLQLWLHSVEDFESVKARAGRTGEVAQVGQISGLQLPEGSQVKFRLRPQSMISGRGLLKRRPTLERTVHWNSFPMNIEFPLRFPIFGKNRAFFETVEVFVEDIPVGECVVMMEMTRPLEVSIASEFKRIRSGFASYSSKDRAEVIGRLQMLELVLGWAPFLDIMSLRSGDDWETRLYTEIEAGDVFLLFWSTNASTSEWVEKEWRHALRTKGIKSIVPIALERTPAPNELRKLQFSDKWTRFVEQAVRERADRG